MWYLSPRIITAGLEDTLANLAAQGVSEQIINRVRTAPPEHMGHYINQLMRNPAISENDLISAVIMATGGGQQWYNMNGNLTPEAQLRIAPPSRFELQVSEMFLPQFQKWPLVYLKKLRSGVIDRENFTYRGFEAGTPTEQYWNVNNTFQQLADWSRGEEENNPYFQISAYDLTQALQKSYDWHQTLIGQGEGKMYTPYTRDEEGNITDERVVHQYEDGWHISQVIDANDLSVEGNKMHHCVGGYCSAVRGGHSRIFSLRDPKNHPVVTIEMDGSSNLIKQIKANFDEKPEQDLRLKLAEWFGTLEDAHFTENHYEWEGPDWSPDPESIRGSIYEEAYGREPYDDEETSEDYDDDYGVPGSLRDDTRKIEDLDVSSLLDSVEEAMVGTRGRDGGFDNIRRNPQWYKEHDVAEALASVILDYDKTIMKQILDDPTGYLSRRLINPDTGLYDADKVRAKLGVFDVAEKFNEKYEEILENVDDYDLTVDANGRANTDAMADESDEFRIYYITTKAIIDDMTEEIEQMYGQLVKGGVLIRDLNAITDGNFKSAWSRHMSEQWQPRLMKHREDFPSGTLPTTPEGQVDESVFDESGWKYSKRFHGWYRAAAV